MRSRIPMPGEPARGALPLTQPAPQRTLGNPPVGSEATVDIHRRREGDSVSLHEPLTLGTVPSSLLHHNGALTSKSGNNVPGMLTKVAVLEGQQGDLEGCGSQVRPASAR